MSCFARGERTTRAMPRVLWFETDLGRNLGHQLVRRRFDAETSVELRDAHVEGRAEARLRSGRPSGTTALRPSVRV